VLGVKDYQVNKISKNNKINHFIESKYFQRYIIKSYSFNQNTLFVLLK